MKIKLCFFVITLLFSQQNGFCQNPIAAVTNAYSKLSIQQLEQLLTDSLSSSSKRDTILNNIEILIAKDIIKKGVGSRFIIPINKANAKSSPTSITFRGNDGFPDMVIAKSEFFWDGMILKINNNYTIEPESKFGLYSVHRFEGPVEMKI
jgi:hypothetical protein